MDETLAPPYKIVLLGDTSVGKTSIVHRFINGSFDDHTSNTIGAAFSTKLYKSKNDTDKVIKIEIWDTAGQERYRSLTPMYYRNAKVALVCFDMSNFEDTFERAKYWIDQVLLHTDHEGADKISVKLIGNKLDIIENNENNDSESIKSEIAEYCALKNLRPNFTSAKTGKGIEEVFDEIVEEVDPSFIKQYHDQIKKDEMNGGQFTGINIFKSRSQNRQCC